MERIVLKHLSGSKANQVEEFPLAHVKELILGRDPSSTVKYDPDRDEGSRPRINSLTWLSGNSST